MAEKVHMARGLKKKSVEKRHRKEAVRRSISYFIKLFFLIPRIKKKDALTFTGKTKALNAFIFQRFYLFIFRGGKGWRKGSTDDVWEKHRSVVFCTPPTGDLAHNPGMCPDQESNQWPFSLQADTQSTEPHQPGQPWTLLKVHFTSKSIKN